MAADRRRVNGPPGGTAPPVFAPVTTNKRIVNPKRFREPDELRRIFLKTGLTPSASGSAYLELQPSSNSTKPPSAVKLTCTVHGPRPLPRSAPFSPQLLLSTRVKFAPFASRQRKGYIPDPSERDLAAHLETALRGILIGERWPKSGVDVIVTVLEGEEDYSSEKDNGSRSGGWGMMSILSGCITVASAAITDAGIDSVDVVTGGVAAIVREPKMAPELVLDPAPAEHSEIVAACVIGYLQSRDEITEMWTKGTMTFAGGKGKGSNESAFEELVEKAVEAATRTRLVLVDAVREGTEAKVQASLPPAGFEKN